MDIQHYEPLGIGAGTLFAGRYYIERSLGSGSTSAVYKVRDRALNNEVCALKILDPRLVTDGVDVERFRNEVVLTRRLTHPNIVRTFEFGCAPAGQYFLTMEYLPGMTLKQAIQGSSADELSFPIVVSYLLQIAGGLAYAHETGVIHRDLKAANVLVSESGQVKIADFGLARPADTRLNLTETGRCVGTPLYMSPEQVRGHSATVQSDIYSFGVLAFELATGRLPFQSDDWISLAKKIVEEPFPKAGSALNRIPAWFELLIQKAAAKRPENRFETMKEVIEILQQHQGETQTVCVKLSGPGAARARSAITEIGSALNFSITHHASAFLVVTLLLTAAVAFVGYPREAPQPQGTGTVDNFTRALKQNSQAIDKFADTLEKLNTAVVKTYQNKDKIEKFIAATEQDTSRPLNGESPSPSLEPAPEKTGE